MTMHDDRTYEAALAHLASLQSNLAVTSLFSKPLGPAPILSSGDKGSDDPNAPAIPEMLAWLRRAGIEAADLGGKEGQPQPQQQQQQQQGLRCVHVAGTKGKGSVCAFLTSILTRTPAAGRVGTYTSPHLVSVRERILLDGAPISRDLFARYFFEVWDALTEAARGEALALLRSSSSSSAAGPPASPSPSLSLSEEQEREIRGPATKPFYFRFLTILALHAFRREGVRTAVVECGIGGEHDATNVLPPAAVTASVVAQLGVDHVAMLGDSVPRIAWHKAGVCKPRRRCFTRLLPPEDAAENARVMQVLRDRAREKGAVLVELDDAAVASWGGVTPAAGTLEGEFQVRNQALAVAAAREHLRVLAEEGQAPLSSPSSSTAVPPTAAAEASASSWFQDLPSEFIDGLRGARLRGRCETRVDDGGAVTWLVDGAHTADSLREVARWFVSKTGRSRHDRQGGMVTVLLFNQQERDAAALLRGLLESIAGSSAPSARGARAFDRAIFTRNDALPRKEGEPERDLSVQRAAAATMRELAPETAEVVAVDSIAEAVGRIRSLGESGGGKEVVVLATGSLHLVGALLRTLEPDAEL